MCNDLFILLQARGFFFSPLQTIEKTNPRVWQSEHRSKAEQRTNASRKAWGWRHGCNDSFFHIPLCCKYARGWRHVHYRCPFSLFQLIRKYVSESWATTTFHLWCAWPLSCQRRVTAEEACSQAKNQSETGQSGVFGAGACCLITSSETYDKINAFQYLSSGGTTQASTWGRGIRVCLREFLSHQELCVKPGRHCNP